MFRSTSANTKAIALDALRCPVWRALKGAWERARQHAWWNRGPNMLGYSPDFAVEAMREELGALVRSGVLEYWEVCVHEGWGRLDWGLEVLFTYRHNGQVLRRSETFRLY